MLDIDYFTSQNLKRHGFHKKYCTDWWKQGEVLEAIIIERMADSAFDDNVTCGS